MENLLWYESEAKHFNEALPIGNGQIGAMVYGGVRKEKISLNHDTFWSGTPNKPFDTDLRDFYKQSQKLASKGKYFEAEKIIEQNICTNYNESYMPLGDLYIDTSDEHKTYKRSLDLDTAIHNTYYDDTIKTTFISAPDDVLVHKIVSKNKIENVKLSFKSKVKHNVYVKENILVLDALAPTCVYNKNKSIDNPPVYDDKNKGISACACAKIISDGEISYNNDSIIIKSAKEITIYLSVKTSFIDYKTNPCDYTYIEKAMKILNTLPTYDEILQSHIKDYSELERRSSFVLKNSSKNKNLPTDKRLELYKNDKSDLGFYELLWRFGRYLLISCSRPNTQTANLQGIWNEDLNPAWNSAYTVNINTQMCYFPVFMVNLSKCAYPLIDLVCDLAVSGKDVSKNIYDARGYVAHHNIDIWRSAYPTGNKVSGCVTYAFWQMGGVWLTRILCEYFEYTKDLDFLKNKAYPVIKDCALFLLDILTEDENGNLIISPTTSPENRFHYGEKKPISLTKSSSMSQSICYDILQKCNNFSKILQDFDFSKELESVIKRIIPVKIDEDGRILEWHDTNTKEDDKKHRHISHLYALHPAKIINPLKDIDLTRAAKETLRVRGDGGTGWSLAWKINMWARLLDGEKALELINKQLSLVDDTNISYEVGGTYKNMLCAHPPFQIDGNSGVVSGISEMIVQSEENIITLLPAVPKVWKDFKITGFLAKGNVLIDLEVKNHKLIFASATAKFDGEFIFCYNDREISCYLTAESTKILELFN